MSARLLLIPIAIAAAACTGAPRAPEAEHSERERIVTSLAEIAGPWDIVRFGEHRPTRLGTSGGRRAYVNIDPKGLSYTIECNYSGNAARIDASGVLHDESDGSRMQTQMGCGRELEARDDAFFGFFGTKPKVTLLGDGRLRMSNGRTQLVLERPGVRRLANIPPLREITGRWLPRMAMRVFDTGGHEGWGFQEPHVLSIAEDRISYSGCGGVAFAFRYTKDAKMVTAQENAPADCGQDTPGTMLIRVLSNDPFVERTAGGGIALSAQGEVISLQSEAELRRQRENPPPPPPLVITPPAPPPPPPAVGDRSVPKRGQGVAL